eukprot:TRINITY_DN13600_c0_g1_i1.p1 TRINITY_DN13600_c0_g1~~TRINITY_DN13600_c0_g1_i1.p1  ORF type:complete len:1420 (+),score=490.18 TRINITY_DN13600_c0_g1_i1:73-4332(+)
MLERRKTDGDPADLLTAVLPFRGVVFEADEQRDPSPMNLLRVLSQKATRQCKMVLYKSGLSSDLASLYSVVFDVVFDSAMEKKMDVKPKPSPEGLVKCLTDLDIRPELTVGFVTTLEGAAACHAANFGLVVASAPRCLEQEDDFRAAGVDVVLPDSRPLELGVLCWLFTTRVQDSGWQLRYHIYNPGNERLRETISTVGNGYMGVRGSSEWSKLQGEESYAGCYLAGVYNCSPSTVRGLEIHNSDLVNCPDWTAMRLRIGDDDWVDPTKQNVLEYTSGVDMRTAQTERYLTFEDAAGRRTNIKSARIASMASMHQGGMVFTVKALNYSEPITIRSSIEGDVRNRGVERYSGLNDKHLRVKKVGSLPSGVVYVVSETTGLRSPVEICTAAKHTVAVNDRDAEPAARRFECGSYDAAEVFVFKGTLGVSYAVEKLVTIFTSRDAEAGGRTPFDEATTMAAQQQSFNAFATPHRMKWSSLWDRMDMQLHGDRRTWLLQKMARLHLYHLLSSCSPNNVGLDAGLTARGLTGENHRGHVFWDEAFCFPVLVATNPEVAKAHLMYRTNRTAAAKAHAKQHGCTGAMVPWQTSDSGGEDTQIVKYNPMSQKWDPDMSRRQRHVGIAVFLDGWRYFEATRDTSFLEGDLGELMLEIARFFADLARLDPADGKFHIAGVMGPDEYHEEVNCRGGGVVDNAYTNIMVVWMLTKALDIARGNLLSESGRSSLVRRIGLTAEELKKWEAVSGALALHVHADGRIEQFQGWAGLADLDWDGYRQKYENLQRLDRILRAEGKRPDDFKIVKQPDLLMAFYFLSLEEVGGILKKMGVTQSTIEVLRQNYDYYVPLTTAGSALAFTVHARLAKLLGREESQAEWMMEAVNGDVFGQRSADGAATEGVHLGVMAGTIDLMVASTLGLRIVSDSLYELRPQLLPSCTGCSFNRLIRGCWFNFEISRQDVTISMQGPADWSSSEVPELHFALGDSTVKVGPWRPVKIRYAITDLKDFVNTMRRTRVVRADILRRVFTGRPLLRQQLLALRSSRDTIMTLPRTEERYTYVLDVDGQPRYRANLHPELNDLERDLCFLHEGEDVFFEKVLRRDYPDYDNRVLPGTEWVMKALGGAKKFKNLITSRDGTIMPRPSRYLSSIQPAYNSVFLTRFALQCCENSTIITASPLGGESSDRGEPVEANGLWDLSVNPPDIFSYAGSMGRSYLTTQEVRGGLAIDEKTSALHQAFSRRLQDLLRTPQFEKHRAFGHGMQTRWGLSVVPKNDDSIRLSKPEEERLLAAVTDIARAVDPAGKLLKVVDTDRELAVSIRPAGTRVGEWTKGDGIRLLDSRLGLELSKGPNLLALDRAKDLPMLDYALSVCPDTWCVIVTQDEALIRTVESRYPQCLILPTPDHLLGVMNTVAKRCGSKAQVLPPGPAGRL